MSPVKRRLFFVLFIALSSVCMSFGQNVLQPTIQAAQVAVNVEPINLASQGTPAGKLMNTIATVAAANGVLPSILPVLKQVMISENLQPNIPQQLQPALPSPTVTFIPFGSSNTIQLSPQRPSQTISLNSQPQGFNIGAQNTQLQGQIQQLNVAPAVFAQSIPVIQTSPAPQPEVCTQSIPVVQTTPTPQLIQVEAPEKVFVDTETDSKLIPVVSQVESSVVVPATTITPSTSCSSSRPRTVTNLPNYLRNFEIPINFEVTLPPVEIAVSDVLATPSPPVPRPCSSPAPYQPFPSYSPCWYSPYTAISPVSSGSRSGFRGLWPIILLSLFTRNGGIGGGGSGGGLFGGFGCGGGGCGGGCSQGCSYGCGCGNCVPVPYPIPIPYASPIIVRLNDDDDYDSDEDEEESEDEEEVEKSENTSENT